MVGGDDCTAPANGTTSKRDGARKRRMSKKERKKHKKRRMGNAAEPMLEDYMRDYSPAPLAKPKPEAEAGAGNSRSLGKWFPTASVIKSGVSYSNDHLAKLAKERKKRTPLSAGSVPAEPKASLVLFYQYVRPAWSPAKVTAFLAYLTTVAEGHRTNLGGRIRVSGEGVNATVSAASPREDGPQPQSAASPAFQAARTLRHFAEDVRRFDPTAFADTDFKFVDGLSADRHFNKLKLLPVKELVFYDLKEGDFSAAPASNDEADNGAKDSASEVKGGVHLAPTEYHEMLKRDDAVVIDVRNHYEAVLGRFDGQMRGAAAPQAVGEADGEASGAPAGGGGHEGAEYIDPKMRKSTDFKKWLGEEDTQRRLSGKTVLMFCTGGIRCERASAYLNSQIGAEVKGVYQLKGGVERYLQAFPEGGFWSGKNYVFDKREAIGAGNINGDGGVLIRKDVIDANGKCAKCGQPWDRYIGKRKCYTCGVPVLVCDACTQSSPSASKGERHKKRKKRKKGRMKENVTFDKGESTKEGARIQCPLCIEEGVTVPVVEVEYTNNGVSNNAITKVDSTTQKDPSNKNRAAKSVLKWGGGHATKKKEKRKCAKRLCQFGAECYRKNCLFYHPEREGKACNVVGN